MSTEATPAVRVAAARLQSASHRRELASDRRPRTVLFASGFRPFFLLAGVSAVVLIGVWLFVVVGGQWPDAARVPSTWHAHEMLFGVVGAAITGFLLTAVPNWTGAALPSGGPLALLAALWLAGRIAVSPWMPVPPVLAAVVDIGFFPVLASLLAGPLLHAGKWQNAAFVPVLLLLAAANLMIHLDWLGVIDGAAAAGLRLAIDVVLLMVAIVGGRIVPAFTQNALRRTDPGFATPPLPWLERLAVGSVLAMAAVDTVLPDSWLAGTAALVAAAAHAMRVARWRGHRTAAQPILLVLHVAYASIVVGLALKAAWLLGEFGWAACWVHAVTIGGFATMILAVMSRAALGHTGRPLVAPKPVALAYALLPLAALLRAAAPAMPEHYLAAILGAGALWSAAFLLFVIVYVPILLRPRVDSRAG